MKAKENVDTVENTDMVTDEAWEHVPRLTKLLPKQVTLKYKCKFQNFCSFCTAKQQFLNPETAILQSNCTVLDCETAALQFLEGHSRNCNSAILHSKDCNLQFFNCKSDISDILISNDFLPFAWWFVDVYNLNYEMWTLLVSHVFTRPSMLLILQLQLWIICFISINKLQ